MILRIKEHSNAELTQRYEISSVAAGRRGRQWQETMDAVLARYKTII